MYLAYGCVPNGPPARRSEPDWRREGAYLNGSVTDEQRGRRPLFNATLRAAAGWLFFRVARSLRINLDMLVAPPASLRETLRVTMWAGLREAIERSALGTTLNIGSRAARASPGDEGRRRPMRSAKSGLRYPDALRLTLLAHFNYSLAYPDRIPTKDL
jgi:hypothetical protein